MSQPVSTAKLPLFQHALFKRYTLRGFRSFYTLDFTAYTATVLRDGKPFARVDDRGDGGPTSYCDPVTFGRMSDEAMADVRADFLQFLQDAGRTEDYALASHDGGQTFEVFGWLMDEMMTRDRATKRAKALLKANLVFIGKDGKVGAYSLKSKGGHVWTAPDLFEAIKARRPADVDGVTVVQNDAAGIVLLASSLVET